MYTLEEAMTNKLINEQKLFRRIILIWAMVILTIWSCFLMDVSLLVNIGAAGATVVTAVFGILTTVIGFYQWHRNKDDERQAAIEKTIVEKSIEEE